LTLFTVKKKLDIQTNLMAPQRALFDNFKWVKKGTKVEN